MLLLITFSIASTAMGVWIGFSGNEAFHKPIQIK